MYDIPLYQFDIKNAFLHGDFNEEVYMEQLPGFVAQGEMICRLKKALYGLKQSPKVWFSKFSEVVLSFGMSRCRVNHSVFYFHSARGSVWLLVYVDDIIITSNESFDIGKLKVCLQKNFNTKDLGPLKFSMSGGSKVK